MQRPSICTVPLAYEKFVVYSTENRCNSKHLKVLLYRFSWLILVGCDRLLRALRAIARPKPVMETDILHQEKLMLLLHSILSRKPLFYRKKPIKIM
jgi:hypothetical protein